MNLTYIESIMFMLEKEMGTEKMLQILEIKKTSLTKKQHLKDIDKMNSEKIRKKAAIKKANEINDNNIKFRLRSYNQNDTNYSKNKSKDKNKNKIKGKENFPKNV